MKRFLKIIVPSKIEEKFPLSKYNLSYSLSEKIPFALEMGLIFNFAMVAHLLFIKKSQTESLKLLFNRTSQKNQFKYEFYHIFFCQK